jgi:hypothetical protein
MPKLLIFLKKAAILIVIPIAIGLIGSLVPMRVMQDDIAATYAGGALGILGVIFGIIIALAVIDEIF